MTTLQDVQRKRIDEFIDFVKTLNQDDLSAQTGVLVIRITEDSLYSEGAFNIDGAQMIDLIDSFKELHKKYQEMIVKEYKEWKERQERVGENQ